MKKVLLLILGIQLSLICLSQRKVIQMRREGGISLIDCKINDLSLSFVFDTGASDISISLTEVLFMLKNNYLTESDIIGSTKFTDATGAISEGYTVILRQIEFAGIYLYNIKATVVNNLKAPLLLGQSVLRKLGKFELDLNSNTLVLINPKSSFDYSNFSPKTKSAPSNRKAVRRFSLEDNDIKVKITTDLGIIIVKLYDSTPLHRDNFVKLVNQGFYDSLMFHRVIPQFMIQGGDPMSKNATPGGMLGMGGGDMARIPAEFRPYLFHKKGALAAARDGNPEKASSACQFYIVEGRVSNDSELDMIQMQKGIKYSPEQRQAYKTIGGTPFLDQEYTVFGEVVSGLEVIGKIVNVPRDANNRPQGDVRMKMELLK